MTNEDLRYLRGEKFSNNYHFRSIRDYPGKSRIDILKSESKGKRVIHLGAADHKSLIAEKIQSGIWLHEVISNVSSECIGVDIAKDAVDYLKDKHGVKNMVNANIFDPETVRSFRDKGVWDQILLGEILEHIPNPVDFLFGIRERYTGIVSEIIVTVPNAFAVQGFFDSLNNLEAINSDHKYSFTPYTLASVATAAGFTPDWIAPCHYVWQLPRRHFITRFLQTRYPLFRSCLILKASL